MERDRGKFIVVEGVGGAGKSEQSKRAYEHFRSQGVPMIHTREPGGIEQAETIRRLIFNLKSKELINADHQLALFFAARAIWVNDIIAPNISHGTNVLSDRTYPSTGAYQGYAEGGDIALIESISKEVMAEYKPDGILLLDVNVDTALKRNSENKDGDPFDYQEREYFEKIVCGYREMAEQNWSDVQWHVVDANRGIEAVQMDVRDIICEILTK